MHCKNLSLSLSSYADSTYLNILDPGKYPNIRYLLVFQVNHRVRVEVLHSMVDLLLRIVLLCDDTYLETDITIMIDADKGRTIGGGGSRTLGYGDHVDIWCSVCGCVCIVGETSYLGYFGIRVTVSKLLCYKLCSSLCGWWCRGYYYII